jgi:hypothetical protein
MPFVMNSKELNHYQSFNHRFWACSIDVHFKTYND